MRLIHYNPQWLNLGERFGLGITMECLNHSGHLSAILFSNPVDGGPPFQGSSWNQMLELVGSQLFRGCGDFRWERKGDTFETLTLLPSVNMHSCGHFNIESGEIKVC